MVNSTADRIESKIEQVKINLNRLLIQCLPVEASGTLAPLYGKFNRARLVLAFAELGGNINASAMRIASGMELLHLASLVQDDIVDRSDYRRGRPAVNRVIGVGAALLLSDWLFGEAYHFFCMGLAGDFERFNRLVKAMAMSELRRELAIQRHSEVGVGECLRYNCQKTALFFQTCSYLGIQSAGVDKRTAVLAGRVGLWWGMAYQLRNDVQDLVPKPHNNVLVDQDRGRGMLTLPLIWLLQWKPEIQNQIWQLTSVELWRLLKQSGSLTVCNDWYSRFLDKAEDCLSRLEAPGNARLVIGKWLSEARRRGLVETHEANEPKAEPRIVAFQRNPSLSKEFVEK